MNKRLNRKYVKSGKGFKLVRNRFGGDQPPKGGYGSGFVQQRRARAKQLLHELVREYGVRAL